MKLIETEMFAYISAFLDRGQEHKAPCGMQPSSTEYQNSSQVFGRHPTSRRLAPCCRTSVSTENWQCSGQSPCSSSSRVSVGIWGYEKTNLLFNCLLVRVGSLGSNTYRHSLKLYACLHLALANITLTFSLPGAQEQFYKKKKKKKSTWSIFHCYYLPETWKAITHYIDKCCCCSSK